MKSLTKFAKGQLKTSSLNYVSRYYNHSYNKICASSKEAVKDVKDGDFIAIGGFGICGIPENLIKALAEQGTKDLTLVSNNGGKL